MTDPLTEAVKSAIAHAVADGDDIDIEETLSGGFDWVTEEQANRMLDCATQAAIAAMREQLVPQWQPIETAPRDIELLVLRRDKAMHVARVGGYYRRYGILSADFGNASCSFFFPVGDNRDDDDAPTHWMPLPAAPTEGEG